MPGETERKDILWNFQYTMKSEESKQDGNDGSFFCDDGTMGILDTGSFVVKMMRIRMIAVMRQ